MKKQSDKFNGPHDDRLGRLLGETLAGCRPQRCVSLEEIAALVDGSVSSREKDEIMAHLSCCDDCYQTFLLTSRLNEKSHLRTAPRSFISHPAAVAASLIVALFTVFLVYKIFDGSGKSLSVGPEREDRVAEVAQPAPPLPQEGIAAKPHKEELPSRLAVGFDQDLPADDAKPGAAAPRPQKKEPARLDEPKQLSKDKAGTGQEATGTAAPIPRTEKGRERQTDLFEDASPPPPPKSREVAAGRGRNELQKKDRDLKDEEQTPPKSAGKVKSKKGERRQSRENEEFEVGAAIGLQAASAEGEKKAASKGRESAAFGKVDDNKQSTVDPRLKRIKREFTESDAGYLPARDIEKLFKETLAACSRLESTDRRFANRPTEAAKIDTPPDTSNAAGEPRETAPTPPIILSKDRRPIPHAAYFQSRCRPGSAEYEFFGLAASGWSDNGSRWLEPATAPDDRSPLANRDLKHSLLQKWRELRPRLTGPFKAIADNTVVYLEK